LANATASGRVVDSVRARMVDTKLLLPKEVVTVPLPAARAVTTNEADDWPAAMFTC
jgi:hypothetical protein